MRVVSQNGKFDIPYEQASFHLSDNYIYAHYLNDKLVFAMYDTDYQAEKAMKSLHKAYQDIKIFEATGECVIQPAYTFRFPEEEVLL